LTNIVDRITDGRARTDRDCPCSDKFIVMDCMENGILASEFETARKLESERIGLSVNIVCDLVDEISISGGAVH
jgi:hypothetical protein